MPRNAAARASPAESETGDGFIGVGRENAPAGTRSRAPGCVWGGRPEAFPSPDASSVYAMPRSCLALATSPSRVRSTQLVAFFEGLEDLLHVGLGPFGHRQVDGDRLGVGVQALVHLVQQGVVMPMRYQEMSSILFAATAPPIPRSVAEFRFAGVCPSCPSCWLSAGGRSRGGEQRGLQLADLRVPLVLGHALGLGHGVEHGAGLGGHRLGFFGLLFSAYPLARMMGMTG